LPAGKTSFDASKNEVSIETLEVRPRRVSPRSLRFRGTSLTTTHAEGSST
jgi:hypothetical protein